MPEFVVMSKYSKGLQREGFWMKLLDWGRENETGDESWDIFFIEIWALRAVSC